MPFYLKLKAPLVVEYQTRNGKQNKILPPETLLPIIRKYEPKKPMHRKFPYDVLVEGVGLRRMGNNPKLYDVVEIKDE